MSYLKDLLSFILYTIVISFIAIIAIIFKRTEAFKEEYSNFIVSSILNELFDIIKQNPDDYQELIIELVNMHTLPLALFQTLRDDIKYVAIKSSTRKVEWRLKIRP